MPAASLCLSEPMSSLSISLTTKVKSFWLKLAAAAGAERGVPGGLAAAQAAELGEGSPDLAEEVRPEEWAAPDPAEPDWDRVRERWEAGLRAAEQEWVLEAPVPRWAAAAQARAAVREWGVEIPVPHWEVETWPAAAPEPASQGRGLAARGRRALAEPERLVADRRCAK